MCLLDVEGERKETGEREREIGGEREGENAYR